jgi:hypothetical protein
MATHDLKVWPEFFTHLRDGSKTFEARREDDRRFEVGDRIVLREYDPFRCLYSGAVEERVVSYLLRGPRFGVEAGHVILALVSPPSPSRAEDGNG